MGRDLPGVGRWAPQPQGALRAAGGPWSQSAAAGTGNPSTRTPYAAAREVSLPVRRKILHSSQCRRVPRRSCRRWASKPSEAPRQVRPVECLRVPLSVSRNVCPGRPGAERRLGCGCPAGTAAVHRRRRIRGRAGAGPAGGDEYPAGVDAAGGTRPGDDHGAGARVPQHARRVGRRAGQRGAGRAGGVRGVGRVRKAPIAPR